MKRLVFVSFMIVLASGLLACGNEAQPDGSKSTSDVSTNDTDKSKDVKANEKSKEDEYVDGPLTEIGQKVINEDKSIVELINFATINEKISVEPIDITIQEIKLLKMSNIESEQMEYFQLFVEKNLADPLNYIQVTYVAENTSDEDIGWIGITHLILSNGEQIAVASNDFAKGNETDPDFYGKVKKETYFGVPYQGDPEDIKNIKLVIGKSYNPENYIAITKEKQVTYEFN